MMTNGAKCGWMVLAAAIGLPAAAPGEETADLRLRFTPGRVRYVERVEQSDQKISSPQMPGGAVEMEIENATGMFEKAESVEKTGVKLSLTYDRTRSRWAMSMTGGQTLRYDSDQPGEEDTPYLRQIFAPMLGKSLSVELDASGRVRSLTGMAAIVKAIEKEAAGNPIFMQMRETMTDENAALSWGAIRYIILPNRRVKVGETWTAQLDQVMPRIGEMVLSFECKLDSVGKVNGRRAALISYSGTIKEVEKKDEDEKTAEQEGESEGDEDAPAEEKPKPAGGTFRGTVTFDLERGEIVERVEDAEMTFTLESPMGSMGVEMKRKTTTRARTVAEREAERKENRRKAEAARAAAEKAKREKARGGRRKSEPGREEGAVRPAGRNPRP